MESILNLILLPLSKVFHPDMSMQYAINYSNNIAIMRDFIVHGECSNMTTAVFARRNNSERCFAYFVQTADETNTKSDADGGGNETAQV